MNEEDQDTYILAEDGKLDLDELFSEQIFYWLYLQNIYVKKIAKVYAQFAA